MPQFQRQWCSLLRSLRRRYLWSVPSEEIWRREERLHEMLWICFLGSIWGKKGNEEEKRWTFEWGRWIETQNQRYDRMKSKFRRDMASAQEESLMLWRLGGGGGGGTWCCLGRRNKYKIAIFSKYDFGLTDDKATTGMEPKTIDKCHMASFILSNQHGPHSLFCFNPCK